MKKICDRVTVMRDGEYVGMRNMNEVTINEIITMMVGREIYEESMIKSRTNQEVVLEVKNLTRRKKVKNVGFN